MSEPLRSATTSSMRIQSLTASPVEIAGALVVYHLYSLLRAATMYEPGHPQVTAQAGRFLAAVRPQFGALATDALHLVLSGAHLFVNGEPVRADAAEFARAQWLSQQFDRLQLVEFELHRGATELELTEFCRRFALALQGHGPMDELRDLHSIEVTVARVDPAFESLLGQLLRLSRYPLLQLYAEGLSRTTAWWQSGVERQRPDLVVARRIAGQLVDGFTVDPGGMFCLLQLRAVGGVPATRRFHTALVAAGLALRCGLDDTAAREVATTALCRPLPEPWHPWWQRQPLAPADAAAWAAQGQTALHGIATFEALAPLGVVIAPEYYGEERYRHVVSLVIGTAEAFVELLDPDRGTSPFAPEVAVQVLIAQAGRAFDAHVVQALVSLVGLWPPGTVVRLNSGDLAVVVEPPPDGADLGRPTVRLLQDAGTAVYPLSKPELVAYSLVEGVAPSEARHNARNVALR